MPALCVKERLPHILMERLIEYFGHHPWLASAAVVMAVLLVVYEIRTRSENASAVSPQDAIRLMNHGALVLDIRPQAEFATGHLNGARHLPSDQVLTAGETLKKHKEKPVLVYCAAGSLGAAAARQLAAQGFTKALNLRGGVAAWRAENLPLTRS
jgi:rhodanese-related sulfurtransferase